MEKLISNQAFKIRLLLETVSGLGGITPPFYGIPCGLYYRWQNWCLD